MQECKWISRLDTLHPRVTAIQQQKYVIATNKEIVLEEKCPSKIEQKYIKLQKGNHILSLGSACELHVVEPLHSFTIVIFNLLHPESVCGDLKCTKNVINRGII